MDSNVWLGMKNRGEKLPQGVFCEDLEAAHIVPHARNDPGVNDELVSYVLLFVSVLVCSLPE
jgi:hypothetical protein